MRALALTAVLLSTVTPTLAFADGGGGITWKAPASWKEQPQRPMRLATYAIPSAKNDKEDAELGVFYFGEGQGGSVDANVQRWVGQFQQPNGQPAEKVAKKQTRKVNGMDVTTVDVTGTYLAPVGGMMSGRTERKEGYRLLGAIVQGPQGPVFFKMTGPAKTMAAAKPQFDKMLKSLKVEKK